MKSETLPILLTTIFLSSGQFSCSVVSDFSRPHELQHARPPCLLPAPRVYPNSCPLSWRCHPTISSSVVPFSSRSQAFSASGIGEVKNKLLGCPKMQPHVSHGLKKKERKKDLPAKKGIVKVSPPVPCRACWFSACALCTCVCGREPHIIDFHVSFE